MTQPQPGAVIPTEQAGDGGGDCSLRFRNVSKRFVLQHQKARSFQELWLSLVGRQESGSREEFWALKDVSFDVHRGEMVGVIGANGSGKSTLLKLAARTMRPSTGSVLIDGAVVPLLELGAGFHPELSGRENIFLNASILGADRATTQRQFQDIVEFAEIERFIDTPLKHYSSGMYIRLAFAVAAQFSFDILLLDEILAVGDAQFQEKCLRRIAEFRRNGATILYVSHALAQVAQMCDRAVWLDHGCVRAIGPAEEVVSEFVENGS